jgi:hypothetical protein
MRPAAILVVAATGCSSYAHLATTNAPGVTDVTAPMARENGEPGRFEPATDPGTRTIAIIAMPSVMFGVGRREIDADHPTIEPGLELRFERHESAGAEPFGRRALAITAGMGFAQFIDQRPTILGPVYAELSYRFMTGGPPIDIGLGPVFYADDTELGAQLTVRAPLTAVRTRYLPRSGFEIFVGFELPIPFLFSRSR